MKILATAAIIGALALPAHAWDSDTTLGFDALALAPPVVYVSGANTAIGAQAMSFVNSAAWNTAVGYAAMRGQFPQPTPLVTA